MGRLERQRSTLLVILMFLVLMGIGSPVSADVVFVSGDVSGIWSADSVIVTDSIYVSPGNTLEIEPGVHVLFLTANYFRVKEGAVLHAVGTETDTIKFLPAVDGYNTLGIDFEDASDESIVEYCYFTRALYSAIAVTSCNITIRNCLMEGNFGYYRGGGISALDGSEALIEGNTIRDNQKGGVYCNASSPIIRGNIIDGNSSASIGAGIACTNYSSPMISNNMIIDNQIFPQRGFPGTNGQGGAIYCSDESNPVITGNFFSGNRVNDGAEAGFNGGGAIFVFSASPAIENNVFAGNVAEYYDGGAIYLFNSNSLMINNTFVDNSAGSSGGAIYFDLCPLPQITNSILYGNYAPQGPVFYLDRSSEIAVTWSDIEGGWDGEGNVDTEPLFRDQNSGDYHLMATECGDPDDSPLIDAGSPAYIDTLLDCSWGLGTELSDIGAYGGGEMIPTAVDDDIQAPSAFLLASNYPNPFNASTTISYQLPEASLVTLDIFDMLGRKIETLIDNRPNTAGEHKITWDASGHSSGTYFYRLRAHGSSITEKMLFLK
jgi:parallel beta-helix repeat protein/predicted outer membrane repeat protein